MTHWLGKVAPLIGRCLQSRLGWFLAVIHALWLDLGIRTMGPPSRAAANFLDSVQGADWTLFAGRPFHFTYQSWILKSVLLADLPSMLIASVGSLLLLPIPFIRHDAGLLFVVATAQWLIVGWAIQTRFRSKAHTT